MIPFPPFEPDRSLYAANASANIVNCLPVADGWGPQPDLTKISESLGDACKGACAVRNSSGTYRIFAGTADALYELNYTTLVWDDVSRSSGGAYAVPEGHRWTFTQFGSNLIAHNLADVIQFIDADSGTEFAALAGSPPKARFSWVAGEYLVLGHLDGDGAAIQTSGIGDATFWTIGLRGSDYQQFPDGGDVMGGIGAQQGATIFQRDKIRSMTVLSGGEFSFRTDVLNDSRGVIAPHSIASIGPGRYVYYSADGFFMGVEGTPIGHERVDKWFDLSIDRTLVHEILAMPDPFLKIVWFQAPRENGTRFLLGYRWIRDRWCYSDMVVTEMASLVTPAVTIDGMDAYFAVIDDADVPFDSRLFSGGLPVMTVFNSSNELCSISGSPRAATLETADIQLNAGARSWLSEARVIGDVTDFTLRAITSDKHGGTRTVGDAVTPYAATGKCHFRSSALIHAFRMEIPEGAMWEHVTGVESVARPEGQR